MDMPRIYRDLIEFNEGWAYIEEGMSKLKVMDGTYRPFTAEEYMMLHTMVFNMSMIALRTTFTFTGL